MKTLNPLSNQMMRAFFIIACTTASLSVSAFPLPPAGSPLFNDPQFQACFDEQVLANGWTSSEDVTSLSCADRNIQNAYGIQDFSNLSELDLSQNRIESVYPIDQLNQLEVLDLSDNKLVDIYSLPSLQDLRQLNLSGNSGLPETIVISTIQSNPGLTHIGVSGIAMGNDLNWLPYPGPTGEFDLQELEISNTGDYFDLNRLNQHFNLRVLKAAGNQLISAHPVGQLTQLEVLDLSDNQLEEVYTLQSLQNLRQLNLSGNGRLPADNVTWIISANPGLTHIGVSDIAMGDDLNWLPHPGSQSGVNLQELEISNTGTYFDLNQLSGYFNLRVLKAAGNQLRSANSIGQLNQIEVLDLSDNQLEDIFSLLSLQNLRQLNLSGNDRLPAYNVIATIQNNPGLTHISVSDIAMGNDLNWLPYPGSQGSFNLQQLEISNTGDYSDLNQLSQYPNLRVLKAAENQLQNLWFSDVFDQLEVLDLHDNNLSDLNDLRFHDTLTQLNLSGNHNMSASDVILVISSNPGLTHISVSDIAMGAVATGTGLDWLPQPGPQGEFNLQELEISNTGEYFHLNQLSQFINLRVLKAAGNRLLSTQLVDQLTQLEVLDLGDNQLEDIFSLLSLQNLRQLNLSGNGRLPANHVISTIQNNPGLTHIGISGIAMGNDLNWLPYPGPQGEHNLQELEISNTGEYFDLGQLSQFFNLRVLKAAGNQLISVHPVDQLTQLEVLDLSDNQLEDVYTLQSLQNLRQLNLSGNGRLPASQVISTIQNNPGLTHIGVSDIDLSTSALGDNLEWLPYPGPQGEFNLQELEISNTGIYFDLNRLSQHVNLRALKAAGNQLISVHPVGQLTRLEVLDLSDNQLADVNSLQSLQNLRQLTLSGNGRLSASQVIAAIQNNPGLTHIGVSDIDLSTSALGDNLEWLPYPGPQGEFNLQELEISNTGIYFDLNRLSQHVNLRALKAAGNQLISVHPVGQLTRLEVLDLSDNQLADVNSLQSLQNLRQLNLSGNDSLLASEIISTIQNNTGLTHISISDIAMGNDLNWLPYPGPQGEFNLQELEISNTGVYFDLYPLDQYPNLRVLKAAGNQLQNLGSYGYLDQLEVLDLSDNQIADAYPLQSLKNLRQLNLSGNGSLPANDVISVIQNNPGLTHLGVSGIAMGNDLDWLPDSGPQGEFDLQELEISNTGEYFDLYPLDQYRNLRVLEAAGNHLIGTYPVEQLNQLEVVDLSNNDLEYIVPLGDLENLVLLDLRDNNNLQCAQLDQLEASLAQGVLLRPANCLIGNLPSINIYSPSHSGGFYSTSLIQFLADAYDVEDGNLIGQIQWSSDLIGPIGSGEAFDLALTAGEHVITASVVDSDGNATSVSVQISVIANTTPGLTIDSLQDGMVFNAGDLITLSGSATDAEEGNLGSSIQWSSSRGDTLGVGASIQAALSIGDHIISASITDSAGATSIVSVSLRVNSLPQLSLQSPADSNTYQQGDSVDFTGSASDLEDGDQSGAIQWHSNIDGTLGSGTISSQVLSAGAHVITASVTDSDGATVTQTIDITINARPQLEQLSPANGSLFMLQQSVNLDATANDAEDGDISAAILWTSDLDGVLGSGGQLSTNLSLGTHTISASVNDSAGGMQTVTTQIEIDQISLGITVSGTGTRQKAKLTWSGARTDVDIYKDGKKRRVRDASGSTTFRFKNEATFKVCETGTDFCSPDIVVQTN